MSGVIVPNTLFEHCPRFRSPVALGEMSAPRPIPVPISQVSDDAPTLAGISHLIRRVRRLVAAELVLLRVWETLFLATARLLPRHTFSYVRTWLVRFAGVRVGARSRFHGPVLLTGPRDRGRLSVGEESVVAGTLHVDLGAPVNIGHRVHVGPDVAMLTADHSIGPSRHRAGPHALGAITIGDGAWLGARVTVLPGVVVGPGAVVAAGAVVTRNVAANTLVGGVPARKIRDLPNDPEHEFATHSPSWV